MFVPMMSLVFDRLMTRNYCDADVMIVCDVQELIVVVAAAAVVVVVVYLMDSPMRLSIAVVIRWQLVIVGDDVQLI
jgi:hypothetical protein